METAQWAYLNLINLAGGTKTLAMGNCPIPDAFSIAGGGDTLASS